MKKFLTTTLTSIGLIVIGSILLFLALTVSVEPPKMDSTSSATTKSTQDTVSVYTVVDTSALLQQEVALPDVTNKKRSITRIVVDSSNSYLLKGQVGEASINKAINALNDLQADELFLLLDSPGGSVFDGNILVGHMRSSKKKINTVCIGLCASMAAIIFEYGHKRYMLDNAILMFHDVSGGARGELTKMLSMLNFVKRLADKSDLYISKRAGIDFDVFKSRIRNEVWIDGDDAVAEKLADSIASVEGVILEIPVVPVMFSEKTTKEVKEPKLDDNNDTYLKFKEFTR